MRDSPRTGCARRTTPIYMWRSMISSVACCHKCFAHLPLGLSDRNNAILRFCLFPNLAVLLYVTIAPFVHIKTILKDFCGFCARVGGRSRFVLRSHHFFWCSAIFHCGCLNSKDFGTYRWQCMGLSMCKLLWFISVDLIFHGCKQSCGAGTRTSDSGSGSRHLKFLL